MPLNLPLEVVFLYLFAQEIVPLSVKQSWYWKDIMVISSQDIIGKCLYYDLRNKNVQGHKGELQELTKFINKTCQNDRKV